MNIEYVKDVRRFGSPDPFRMQCGRRINLSHEDDFDADTVVTDGIGNVEDMPLLRRKPCFGRPERNVRGMLETKPWRTFRGELRYGETHCERCQAEAPGVFEACGRLAHERIDMDAAIKARFDRWMDAIAAFRDAPERWFVGRPGYLFGLFLSAIETHGGWSNVNDDREKVAMMAKREQDFEKDRERKKAKRAARRHPERTITPEFLGDVDAEGVRRLNILVTLRQWNGSPKWITKLTPAGCARTVDVWKAKTVLAHAGRKVTGRAIAEWMLRAGADYGLREKSLITLVCKDLHRVRKLEGDGSAAAVWPPFTP